MLPGLDAVVAVLGLRLRETRYQSPEFGKLRHTLIYAGQCVALVVHDNEQIECVERGDFRCHEREPQGVRGRSKQRPIAGRITALPRRKSARHSALSAQPVGVRLESHMCARVELAERPPRVS
jgi:hypothetical protein